MGPPKQPPTRIYKTAAKEVMTKIPGQHTWLAIWPQLNPCKGKHRKTVETGATAAIRLQWHADVLQQKPRSQQKPIHHSDRETASEAAVPPFLAAAAILKIRITAANLIAAAIAVASGAVPPEIPLLTVSLRQVPSPGCWAGFQGLPGRLRNTRHLWLWLHNPV